MRNVVVMQTVKQFIDSIGGTSAVAETLGLPISTVSGWNISNSIPNWRIGAVAALAAKEGKPFPASFADKAA